MFKRSINYLERSIVSIEEWIESKSNKKKCNLFLIPACLIIFAKIWSEPELGVLSKFFMALYLPILAHIVFFYILTIGCVLFMTKKKAFDGDTMYACSCSMVYAFVIYVLCGFWFSNDKADRRDELMDHAEQNIRANGKKITVSNLKAAMRDIEMDDAAEQTDYLDSEPPSHKGY